MSKKLPNYAQRLIALCLCVEKMVSAGTLTTMKTFTVLVGLKLILLLIQLVAYSYHRTLIVPSVPWVWPFTGIIPTLLVSTNTLFYKKNNIDHCRGNTLWENALDPKYDWLLHESIHNTNINIYDPSIIPIFNIKHN